MKRFNVSFTMELEDELPTGETIDYTSKVLHGFILQAFNGSLTDNEYITDMVILPE